RPIPGTRAYVLDPRGNEVPVGVVGELYLGGAGVALGYLDRPALTAERFIPDPFSDRPGARLYRTGDRARRRPDGALECLGRLDGLPRSPNGKVDRAALPDPAEHRLAPAGATFEAPRNPAEAALAELAAGLLKVERVGVHDDFFELGFDSILAIQLAARARQA